MPEEKKEKKRSRFADWGEDTVEFSIRHPEEEPVEIKKEAPKDKKEEKE